MVCVVAAPPEKVENANPPIGEGEPIQPKLWGCATALSISEYFED